MAGQSKYEEFYYGYQTKARGLESAPNLTAAFERMSNDYDQLFGPLMPKNGKALDVACGYGNMLYYFRRCGLEHIGFDLDPNQISLANSLGLNAHCGSLQDELRNVGDVSIISAMDVIEHLGKDDAVQFLQNAHSILPVGGLLILKCPCADGFTGAHDIFNDLTHKWGATSNVLKQMLQAVGFSRLQIIDITLPPFPRGIRLKLKIRLRKIARACVSPFMGLLGIRKPTIWSESVVVLAWK